MADGDEDKYFAKFRTVATAVQISSSFYGVLEKLLHIYSHIAFGI
jgi:hypothetical protein